MKRAVTKTDREVPGTVPFAFCHFQSYIHELSCFLVFKEITVKCQGEERLRIADM